MKQLITILSIFAITCVTFGQNTEQSVSSELKVYAIQFDGDDVSNWNDFEVYITSITQANSTELNDKKNEYIVTTNRILDPKIIEGKLVKYGVDFIVLTQK